MIAKFYPYLLEFKRPGGTSRGILETKETFILEVFDGEKKGIGECGLFRGLSFDDVPDYEEKLFWLCANISEDFEVLKNELRNYPSIWFGYEQAIRNLKFGNELYFPNEFTKGQDFIKINGLIWMGSVEFMREQIQEKLHLGFDCLKLKIGTDWPSEKRILEELRNEFPQNQLELRVDANGAFDPETAIKVLEELSNLKIHSIEQPIKAGNVKDMKNLCANTPTPIALDEELIGIVNPVEKETLLKEILPQYIILKPSLVGGFSGTDEWIEIAERNNIGWWITSALESNIGLNAIAQYTYSKKTTIPQGLGTGGLFTNNFETSLNLEIDRLWMKIKSDIQ